MLGSVDNSNDKLQNRNVILKRHLTLVEFR